MSAQGILINSNNQDVVDSIHYAMDHPGDSYASASARANSFWGRFNDFFTGGENAYQAELARQNYEQSQLNSARAWDEYMQSTYYQRMVEDLKKAGLNPWLALNAGIGNTNNYSTAGSGVSAKAQTNKGNAGTVIAAFMIAAAKIIAALI